MKNASETALSTIFQHRAFGMMKEQASEDATRPILLRRRQCAASLTKVGFPISPATLSTMASRGGGPPYHKFGRTVLYRWPDVLAWAEARLSPSRRSSSESGAQQ
jgi:hypothetical protein